MKSDQLKKLVEQLRKLDTTSVSDALDKLGIAGGLKDIKPVVPGVSLCGPAFTVRYIPCGETRGTVGDFLDDVAPGEVVVLDNGGRIYCTVWGDIMSILASQKGIEGTVIDGVCRDIPAIQKLKYPIFTKGYYMVTGKDRVEVAEINGTVALSGVQVKRNDLILGDGSGVVVIPLERAEEVIRVSNHIAEQEAAIEREILGGAGLGEARAKHNYHKLQSKPEK
ncbi:MAG: RraA family protein [Firmicutes bacterium]|nr:RraA family protein [Bacillota bacterium]